METNKLTLVRKRAIKLFLKHKLSVPVDLDVIIKNENISVKYEENYLGIDGLCKLKNNPPEIVLNSGMVYEPRRRFTLAHEIGHIRIPWHTGVDLCSLDDPSVRIQGQQMINTQELEANTFASELLMPTPWLKSNFDLSSDDLSALIEEIHDSANTSYMACFYALENVLPPGHIYFVKTDGLEYWKPYRSVNTGTVRLPVSSAILFYREICDWEKIIRLSIYNIIHFKLFPCPDIVTLNVIYSECNCNFEQFLYRISHNEPIKSIHFINIILEHLQDNLYVIVKIGDSFFRHFRSKNTKIRIHDDCYHDINKLKRYVKENFIESGTINFSENSLLIWIKEHKRKTGQVLVAPDPNELLKTIVRDLFHLHDQKHMMQSISGVTAYINSKNPKATFDELYHCIKLRFETDSKYRDLIKHPDLEKYLTGRIVDFMKNRKNKF